MTDDAARPGSRVDELLAEIVRVAARHTGATSATLRLHDPRGTAPDHSVTAPPGAGTPDGPGDDDLEVPVRAHGTGIGTLRLRGRRPAPAPPRPDRALAEAVASVAGPAIEHARRLDHAERCLAWSRAGTEIATALLSGTASDDVLRAAAARVAELAEADAVGVLVPLSGDEDTLTVTAAIGPGAEDVEGVRIPLAGSRLGAAHRSGVPRLLDEAIARPGAPKGGVIGELAGGYGPTLLLPLGRPTPLGTLVALRTRDRAPFDPAVLEPAAAFATHAAVALELVRSQQRERRLQVQGDRDRIARDLHDHVVQRIFATALALDRIGRSLEEAAPEVAGRIGARVDELDGTIARIRTAIFQLQSAADPSATAVRSRLAEVVRSITDGEPLRPALRIRGEVDDLPADVVGDLIAVVRELVTNVVRHAGATRMTVTVTAEGGLSAVVTDDGRGLPEVVVRSGLVNLADRAERRGGRLTVSSGPSATQIEWTVPLPG
ncbi:sensor histidine kinase [Blastococcus xanthinilyticus]|uniref:Histidine kinase/DNA gyrase B/HSP90-like ATPase n=1 Tax=Blastococcus xanthinilyticus TaxID=1564164 RepID=A0A5S5CW29_9ACTN|nr:ATP-binding protein [Blastococcus xanthinilyticus]TYP87933.1 histidine kinase/DNA gyrase B/HSP90-like ATPase [Blastococcus xanthinilyticus]